MQAIYLFARTPTERTVALLGENKDKMTVATILRLPSQLQSGSDWDTDALSMMMLREGLLDESQQDGLARHLRQLTRGRTVMGFSGNMQSPYETFQDFVAVCPESIARKYTGMSQRFAQKRCQKPLYCLPVHAACAIAVFHAVVSPAFLAVKSGQKSVMRQTADLSLFLHVK